MKDEILRLKREKGALILAHYYQDTAVQDVADFVGDSFDLSKRAKAAKEELIVFCGVRFMAESAKILNPGKTVLLPAQTAGCPMADMITPEDVLALRDEHPQAAVVCYINSTAEVKAVSDICCTSSNAVRVVSSLPQKEIIFVPDRNLGRHVAEKFPDKKFWFFNGYCPTHHNLSADDALAAKKRYPDAPFIVHPECEPEIIAMADYIGSTSQLVDFSAKSESDTIIIGTEVGVVDRLRQRFPEKNFVLASSFLVCPNMKKTRLGDVYRALTEGVHEIHLSGEQIANALRPLDAMMKI